jgi:hypothetical protein
MIPAAWTLCEFLTPSGHVSVNSHDSSVSIFIGKAAMQSDRPQAGQKDAGGANMTGVASVMRGGVVS